MKNIFLKFIMLIVVSLIFNSCDPDKKQSGQEKSKQKPLVAVVNYPLYTFATKIGGEKIDVYFPQIDGDPAFWEPDPASIEKFQNADRIILNGANYAKWMEKVSLPVSTQVNTSKAFSDQLIELQGEVHSHGPEGEHSHTGYAFTTWLDLKNAETQALAVYEVLFELLPQEKETFNNNFIEIRDRLKALDEKLSEIINNQGNPLVFASHPVYQYLAKGYGIQIISFHWEPDQMPSEVDWQEFEYSLDSHSSRAMLWEDDPLPEVRRRLEESGVAVIVFNPGGNRTELDFIHLMERNIENLGMGLKYDLSDQ